MNMKWFLAAVSGLSALVLSFSTEFLASDSQLQAWAQEHRTFVLIATALALIVGIAAAAAGAVDEADAEGERLSGASVAGGIVGSAITWLVAGAAIGWAVEVLLWPYVADGEGFPGATVSAFLVGMGPLRFACLLVGLQVGDHLRYVDRENATALGLVGCFAGGAVGMLASAHLAPAAPLELAPGMVLGIPALAAAGFGASLAAFTAIFKPRFERQGRRADRVKAEAEARRREQSDADREVVERAAARLCHHGLTVRSGETKRIRYRRIFLEVCLSELMSEMKPGQQARVKREIYEGTLDDVVERIGDIVAENEIEPEKRAERRQEFIDMIYAHPGFRPIKQLFELGEDEVRPLLHPPFVVLDARGREVRRFQSAAALAVYAEELAGRPAGTIPEGTVVGTT